MYQINPLSEMLEESSRTLLKHAKELRSPRSRLYLKQAVNRQRYGKLGSLELAKYDKMNNRAAEFAALTGRSYDPLAAQHYHAAKDAIHDGYKAKHGVFARDLDTELVRRNGKGKTRVSWIR